jgi:uncharacterized protein
MPDTNEGLPFFHLFSTPRERYLYDVNTDSILNIPEDVFLSLGASRRGDNACGDHEADLYIKGLKANGFLKSNRVAEVEHPMAKVLNFCIANKLSHVILQVTQSCNLRCSYCVYSGGYKQRGHSQKQMSLDVAKKSIDYLIGHSKDSSLITVGFYGGEPLLRFDMIKECVEYADKSAEGRKVKYGITTNGTLLSDDIIEYFVAHDFAVTISLDGPREIHDKNRRFAGKDKGSFDVLIDNLKRIKSRFPEYYKRIIYNTVLDPSNGFRCVDEFILNDEMFEDMFFSSTVIDSRNAINEIKFEDDFVAEREYEMFKIFLKKIGRLNGYSVSKLLETTFEMTSRQRKGKQSVSSSSLPARFHHSGPCVPAMLRLFVSADGVFYPCERVSELSEISKIGDIWNGVDLEKADRILNIERETDTPCMNCWAYLYCTACFGQIEGSLNEAKGTLSRMCATVRRGVEENFLDYCTLRELGYDFEAEACKML